MSAIARDTVTSQPLRSGALRSWLAASASFVACFPQSELRAANDTRPLEEIIVTAQKQEERLQDVPVPVSAVSAESLVNSNQVRLQDYYTRIPGLNVSPSIQAAQVISIRGVTTGGGNPTVGVTIDDVPYGGSTSLGSGLQVPDIDPSDLARVEVLRGPQGTLYGASSMGGLVKFVTIDPSTEAVSGQLQGGISSVENGDEAGYDVHAAVNLPVADTVAVRASGFVRLDPGYIDDPGLGVEGVNSSDSHGGRLAALWRASDTFSVKLSALYQRREGDGSYDVFPSLGDLQQTYLPSTGEYDVENQAYSATVNADFGSVGLTLLSGYNINKIRDSLDYTPILGPFTPAQFGPGATGAAYSEHQRTRKFTQEVRLTTALGERVDWLVGAFYTDESNSRVQEIFAVDPTANAIVGEWLDNRFPTTFEEYAAFTTFTFTLTDRFDVQLGGRGSRNRQTYDSTRVGPFVPLFQRLPSPLVIPHRRSEADAFTYLLTPRFKLSEDMMFYGRLASGYRAGGPNAAASLTAGVPPEYSPDKTQNYELGMKGDILNGTVSFDASLYYIEWKDIQLDLRSSAGGYLVNGGEAKSQGVELSFELRPLDGMTVATWAVWNEAELTEDLPPPPLGNAFGPAGSRLPYNARLSGNFSIDQEFALANGITALIGGSVSYVDDRLSTFLGRAGGVPLPRQELPSYTKTDLRASVGYEDWTLNLFVNNVADKRGVLTGGRGSFNPLAFTYIQPRTVGLSVVKAF